MISIYLIFTFLCNLLAISADVFVEKLPSLNINIDEIDPKQDIFFIEINTNEDFNKWLNNTDYMTTHYSLVYLYNSSNDNEYVNVHEYVTTELKSFSKTLLDTRHNIINRNCYVTDELENVDDEYEYEELNHDTGRASGFFYIDNLLQCQENIKTLTFVVDLKNIDMKDTDMLSESEDRLLIFPPTISSYEYYRQKYQIQSLIFWGEDGSNDDDNLSLLLEDEEDIIDENKDIVEEQQLSGAELFDKFINECKFSILDTEFREEVKFYEYENLQLTKILENFSDWRFKLWDYLAKTFILYINIPSSMKEQTNTFVYYFVIFFVILMVMKKKVLPQLAKREARDAETSEDDSKGGSRVFFVMAIFSFMIILSSITGYQFVKVNSIVLLAKDEKTQDFVYFAATFNWQFGIETIIISSIYILLMYMMLLILKKSREMDNIEESPYDTKPEIIMNLVSILTILYLIKFVSNDILTMSIFKEIKYFNQYAY